MIMLVTLGLCLGSLFTKSVTRIYVAIFWLYFQLNHPLNGCARGSRPVLFTIRPRLFPIIISIAVCGFEEKKSSQSPPVITIKIVTSVSIPNTRFIHWKIWKAKVKIRNFFVSNNFYRFTFHADCQWKIRICHRSFCLHIQKFFKIWFLDFFGSGFLSTFLVKKTV